MVEYYNPDLDNFFITASPGEQAEVDAGRAGNWQRTGFEFPAGGSSPVCRFYGNSTVDPSTALPYGPNSHFYTLNPTECAGLQAAYQPNAMSWKFEGIAFASTPANADGSCPADTVPIYRAYDRSACVGRGSACKPQPNHRIVGSINAINAVLARGWVGEGTAMCAPSGSALACVAEASGASGATKSAGGRRKAQEQKDNPPSLGTACSTAGALSTGATPVLACKGGTWHYALRSDVPDGHYGLFTQRPDWFPPLRSALGLPSGTACPTGRLQLTHLPIDVDQESRPRKFEQSDKW